MGCLPTKQVKKPTPEPAPTPAPATSTISPENSSRSEDESPQENKQLTTVVDKPVQLLVGSELLPIPKEQEDNPYGCIPSLRSSCSSAPHDLEDQGCGSDAIYTRMPDDPAILPTPRPGLLRSNSQKESVGQELTCSNREKRKSRSFIISSPQFDSSGEGRLGRSQKVHHKKQISPHRSLSSSGKGGGSNKSKSDKGGSDRGGSNKGESDSEALATITEH